MKIIKQAEIDRCMNGMRMIIGMKFKEQSHPDFLKWNYVHNHYIWKVEEKTHIYLLIFEEWWGSHYMCCACGLLTLTGYYRPSSSSTDDPAISILSEVLNGGRLSRFYKVTYVHILSLLQKFQLGKILCTFYCINYLVYALNVHMK